MPHPPSQWSNQCEQEKEALFSLCQHNNIVVKPADKGGAVVVWARDLYIQEAERQLSLLSKARSWSYHGP